MEVIGLLFKALGYLVLAIAAGFCVLSLIIGWQDSERVE